MGLLTYSVIEQLGLTLLHFLWQGTLIGLLFWLTLSLIRPSSAQTRYGLAVGTLLVLGATPVLTFIYLGSASASGSSVISGEPVALMQIAVSLAGEHQAPTLLAWTVAGWLAGVLLLSARLVLGWHYIIKLRQSARHEALAHLKPLLDGLRATMAIRKSVALAVSERISSPVVVGWLKPLVLFPPALINRLDTAQIEMILAHELAHIRRHDHLINLFQTVIETLLFYHPVVALVSRRIRVERENACDDLAVNSTRNRLAYAQMLATLEHLRQPGPRLALGMQDGQILGRIRRLVERSRPRRQLGLTLPALLGLVLAAGSAGVWLMPEPDRLPGSTSETQAVTEVDQTVVTEPVSDVATVVPTSDDSTPSLSLADASESGVGSNERVQAGPDLAIRSIAVEPELLTPATEVSQVQTDRLQNESSSQAQTPSELETQSGQDAQLTDMNRPASDTRQPTTEVPFETAEISNESTAQESIEDGARAITRDAETSGPLLPPYLQVDKLTDSSSSTLELASRPNPVPVSENSAPAVPVAIEPPTLTGGSLIRQIEPDFPRHARRRGVNGMVELEFTIDRRGQVQSIGVVQERPMGWDFGQAAVDAIEQWRFEPYRRGDEAIDRQVRVEVEFDLAEICEISTGSRLPRC